VPGRRRRTGRSERRQADVTQKVTKATLDMSVTANTPDLDDPIDHDR
jgi:hypothetical protein